MDARANEEGPTLGEREPSENQTHDRHYTAGDPLREATPDAQAAVRRNTLAFFDRIAAVCPLPDHDSQDVFTVIIDERHTLGKSYTVQADGSVAKTSNVTVSRGIACQFHVPSLATLAELLRIVGDSPNACLSNSAWTPSALGETFILLSTASIEALGFARDSVGKTEGMTAFARIKEHAKSSSWQLLDRDEDEHTPAWARALTFDQWRTELAKILPGLGSVEMLRCESSSARAIMPNGQPASAGNGHVWLRIADPSDADRTRTAISARALDAGLAWTKPNHSRTTGAVVGKSLSTIVDPSVWTLGRPVFAGKPTVAASMTVRDVIIHIVHGSAPILDTSAYLH